MRQLALATSPGLREAKVPANSFSKGFLTLLSSAPFCKRQAEQKSLFQARHFSRKNLHGDSCQERIAPSPSLLGLFPAWQSLGSNAAYWRRGPSPQAQVWLEACLLANGGNHEAALSKGRQLLLRHNSKCQSPWPSTYWKPPFTPFGTPEGEERNINPIYPSPLFIGGRVKWGEEAFGVRV